MTTNEQDRGGQAFDKWWLEVGIHEMPRGDEPPAHAAIARLAWNAAPAAGVNVEPSALREALAELICWLEDDTLEILRDIPRMGIEWDDKDRELLRAQIEKAKAALSAEQPKSASGGQP